MILDIILLNKSASNCSHFYYSPYKTTLSKYDSWKKSSLVKTKRNNRALWHTQGKWTISGNAETTDRNKNKKQKKSNEEQ